ncbi:hypothetical protein C6T52_20615 [Burkholderia multivorans]|nr:hypothetical protein C6Q05_17880 [Burkholderia multivorans]PRF31506.1 hypothetical protein C6Q10_31315 [Burkholderia multivorans]PRG32213.1 hypothetical protein C6T62_21145 [Burkholderia multivorans]PRG33655.1 hypothetical protein C6T52_20615 [Burkholderia multivorans]PTO47674.1 hypothetical protein DBB31_17725 [Burkholderia multivorans]
MAAQRRRVVHDRHTARRRRRPVGALARRTAPDNRAARCGPDPSRHHKSPQFRDSSCKHP